ncbi:hypothetical protein [Streptomyces milbemycinicus]|uniref:hypothetical protein n=1 Tax=Streptomyces milbemycinicus TaxID=476552 RepID=UPI0033F15E6F
MTRLNPHRVQKSGLTQGQHLISSSITRNRIAEQHDGERRYRVTPVQWLPAERSGGDVPKQIEDIYRLIVSKRNEEVVASQEAMSLLAELGADQVIIGYAFNPYIDGALNTDPERANKLNKAGRIAPHFSM